MTSPPSPRSDLRNSSLCVILCMALLLAAWPFSRMAFNDDWTWAFTVLQLQKTGHLHYNGWSSPPILAQAYWGLLWVKIFGFSFNVLRVSSLPLVAGSIAMCYALARRAGLAPQPAVFVTLMLGLSPVFMPLACTFMTDVPGLFFMLLSMYALIRGFETPSTARAIAWILFGAIVGFVGGSSRQVVWIVPLVVLPYLGWLRRSDRWFAATACAALLAIFAGAIAMQHWFAQQPYSIPDPPAMSYIRSALHSPAHLMLGIMFVLLTTLMLILPAALVLAGRGLGIRCLMIAGVFIVAFVILHLLQSLLAHWTKHHLSTPDIVLISAMLVAPVILILFHRDMSLHSMLAVCLFVAIAIGMRLTHHWLEPWMGNIVTSSGTLGSIELAGNRPHVVPDWLRAILALAVFAILALPLASAILWIIRKNRDAIAITWNYFLKPAGNCAAVPAILLTSLALVALEMTRAVSDVAFDRHLIPLIPFLGILFLICFQQQGHLKMPCAAWGLLIAYAIFAFGFTQEVNALARARMAAVDRLLASGKVADNQIDAGFEHAYWLQAATSPLHYINDARIQNPPDAYDPAKGPTPMTDVLYRLESGPTKVSVPTEFGTVHYFSILPPFHRTIWIDRFTDPWWRDPAKAATRPEKQLLPPALLEQYRR